MKLNRHGCVLFFLFALLPLSGQGWRLPVCYAASTVSTYESLLSAIRGVRAAAEGRIQEAAEQEKVRASWETGKLIDEHVLQHKERADYGTHLLVKLSKDLGTSHSELGYMLQFYRTYQTNPAPGKLSWAHYRELLSVNDAKERDRLAKQAVKENWSQKQLRAAIRLHRRAGARDALQTGESRGSDEGVDAELPAITPGQPYTYQIIKVADELKIDLGFGVYRSVPKTSETPQAAWKENDIIQWQSQPDGTFTIRKTKAANRDLFTYNAKVISVVDGDTFHALIDLGFDTVMAQRVRLRRIDAPEILTAEGKEAKAALEGILFRDGGRIIMQSRELEQHGRPIADVWVHGKPVDIKLVEQGLAVVLNE